jgi:HEAT repeat protein
LGLLKDPKAVSIFFKTLFVERDDVSLFPESAFGIFVSGEQARERALLLLKGEDPETKVWMKERQIPEEEVLARAAQLQIDLRDPEAIPLLVRLLGHKDPAIRMYAARALGRMRAEEAISPLTQMLSPENDAILGVIVKSLVLIGDIKVIPPLKKCSENGPWNQREYCIIGLALLGKQKEIAVLDLLLQQESASFDQECKKIAEEEECAKAKPENMTLRKKNITMYKKVIESFVGCSDTTCLQKLLNSEQPMVRERAAYELGYLGVPQSVTALVDAIRRPPSNAIDLNSRFAALCALEWTVSSNAQAMAKAKEFVPALEIQVEKDKEQILTQPSAEELMRLVVRLR